MLGRGALCILGLVTGLWMQEAKAEPASTQAEHLQVVEFVIGHLGFSKSHREALLAGQPVHSGMKELEHLEEEVAGAGAMVLVRRSAAPEVIEAFLDTEIFKQVHDLVRYDPILREDEDGAMDGLFSGLDPETDASVPGFAEDPTRDLNLRAEELSRLADRDASDPGAVTALLRRVLAERLRRYVEHGLDGVDDYVRTDGRAVSPAQEIRSGLTGLSDLNGVFGGFLDRIGKPLGREAVEGGSHGLHWVEKIVDEKRVVGLLDQAIGLMGDRGMGVEIHYYASSMYNSMVTLVAALPYEDQTLVIAINHTYTDRVRGFGSRIRRRVGRAAVAAALAAHLERVRAMLESPS